MKCWQKLYGNLKSARKFTFPSETVLAWTKRVDAQRDQTAEISSLHELKNFDAVTHKDNGHRDIKHASNTITRKNANTADKSINQDDLQCMLKGVTNVASSTILKQYAGGSWSSMVNAIAREDIHEQESGIKMVNINSIIPNILQL